MTATGQNKANGCELAARIKNIADESHIAPPPDDSCFTARVTDILIDQTDPAGILFSIQDINKIKALQDDVQSAIDGETCQILNELAEIYKNSLEHADSCFTVLSEEVIDFDKPDSITLNLSPDRIFPKHSEIINIWRKRLKFYILEQWYYSGSASENMSLEDMKKNALNKLKCRTGFKRNNPGEVYNFIQDCFLKSIALAYDPHTNFMSSDEVTFLTHMLSSTDQTFGIQLGQNINGDIIISDIIPGSSAWQSNQINSEDIILYVAHKKEKLDFNCISLEDAYYYINKPDYNELTFHIRKRDGKETDITLKKTKMDVDVNRINSFILNGEHKIGYMYLPSFYSETNEYMYIPNGCANDLAKEIIRLKREGIEGLILDLRNNGGGSMLEAIRAAGIFIDHGALSISKSRGEEAETLKDLARGTVFDGPLSVMINDYSASAAELFAAAMQDYNRAVITGTPSFGKATSQIVIPVQTTSAEPNDSVINSGFLKITTGKFYRVTEKSHQLKGIMPDIIITKTTNRPSYKESNMKFTLENDSIIKKTYFRAYSELPIDTLRVNSYLRTEKNPGIHSNQDTLKHKTQGITIPLDTCGFKAFMQKIEMAPDSTHTTSVFTVENPEYIRGMSDAGKEGKIFQDIINNIMKDEIITENYFILNDLINNTKN